VGSNPAGRAIDFKNATMCGVFHLSPGENQQAGIRQDSNGIGDVARRSEIAGVTE
jgi:hypothetical protein